MEKRNIIDQFSWQIAERHVDCMLTSVAIHDMKCSFATDWGLI